MRERELEVWQVFARQLESAMRSRKMSAEELARRIAARGFDGPSALRIRQVIAGGATSPTPDLRQRAENVRLREVIACAAGLGAAPMFLLAPLDETPAQNPLDETPEQKRSRAPWIRFGGIPVPGFNYLNWIRGRIPIGGDLDDWTFFWMGLVPESQREALRRAFEKAVPDEHGGMDARVWVSRQKPAEIAKRIANAEARRNDK